MACSRLGGNHPARSPDTQSNQEYFPATVCEANKATRVRWPARDSAGSISPFQRGGLAPILRLWTAAQGARWLAPPKIGAPSFQKRQWHPTQYVRSRWEEQSASARKQAQPPQAWPAIRASRRFPAAKADVMRLVADWFAKEPTQPGESRRLLPQANGTFSFQCALNV